MKFFDKQARSTWPISLFILLGLTLVCALGIQMLVLLIGVLFSMNDVSALSDGFGISFSTNPVFSYSLIIASSLGTFLFPSLILQRLEPRQEYLPSKSISASFFFLAALFMVVFTPAMQLISEWNSNMSFPAALEGIGDWMRVKEDEMAALTKEIVMVDSWTLLFVNLFAIAVMPAIAEELYFRGSLMNIMQRMLKNKHLTIWLTAVIFSAIHVQFFGFLPRMFLGAFFGYMLLWTQNIWVPIIGHFINNGAAVIIAFYYTRQGKTFEELQASEAYSTYMYVGSFIASALVAWYFYKKTKQINNLDGKGLGEN